MTKHPPADPQTADFSFSRKIPPGDTRPRDVCEGCGFIAYRNPKILVGAVVASGDEILLCRRAIPPRTGFWTMPAGFLEEGETAEAGARREIKEEAGVDVELGALLAVYSVPHISQIQLIYRAELRGGFVAGPESMECALFKWEALPWDALAFPTVHAALKMWHAARGQAQFAPARTF